MGDQDAGVRDTGLTAEISGLCECRPGENEEKKRYLQLKAPWIEYVGRFTLLTQPETASVCARPGFFRPGGTDPSLFFHGSKNIPGTGIGQSPEGDAGFSQRSVLKGAAGRPRPPRSDAPAVSFHA